MRTSGLLLRIVWTLSLPVIVALSVQMFALFGSGYYADVFRQKIVAWGGNGLLPGSAVLAGFGVCSSDLDDADH